VHSELTQRTIDAAAAAVRARSDEGDTGGAWDAAAPLLELQASDGYAALALLRFVDRRAVARSVLQSSRGGRTP
jgi:hypothetical protein